MLSPDLDAGRCRIEAAESQPDRIGPPGLLHQEPGSDQGGRHQKYLSHHVASPLWRILPGLSVETI